jgi:Fur family ferric uptake transcriptional regulator
MEAQSFTALELKLNNFLNQNRIRRSPSRDIVFRLLSKAGDHVRLSNLIGQAQRAGVGEATVYRALQIFQRAGLVLRLHRRSGEVWYEIAREQHDHMICTICNRVLEFHSAAIERGRKKNAKEVGFEIHYARHEVFGLCRKCLKN